MPKTAFALLGTAGLFLNRDLAAYRLCPVEWKSSV
jgi:hypothetical protein